MRSWTGLDNSKGFFGVSVTVFVAVLYTADFSLMSFAFLASKNPFLAADSLQARWPFCRFLELGRRSHPLTTACSVDFGIVSSYGTGGSTRKPLLYPVSAAPVRRSAAVQISSTRY